ncbi:sugar phosphate isomerase/epimerase and 4-hydroxyphenylpyruvate domain-containing protein [uncultured Methylobacterium sp.]|jgi:4-hydroxyphenylpyruvate dioxygenase|uniref:bifunctional sugar phosphate isomerase/epimerase/4-hydroxyphenylpyruvate dioxygenase family protein n=1 Tax=uncultured Methylobacterium sp. TaxID=157278 RepID=UPI00262F5166|nr:sugar phosphate isomerase/epimerase and 4-hydroxyphenylpyruvate domain-containing protein [uncultured Methylobacterium sp.]
MRKAIATVSLSGTLIEKLEAISAARFDGVEIFENDLLFHTGAARDVRRYASDLGLTIDLFQPFRDFEGVSDEQLRRNYDRAERKFDLMEELGAPLILVCSNVGTEVSDDDDRMAEQLYGLAERAGRRGLKIGYEALSWGTRVRTFDRAWRIVERANHPHLGLILDSFHTLALPDEWSGIASLPGQRVFFVQLADAPRLGMNALTLSRHFRCLPGQGDLDVPGFLQAVLASGYTGTISLEIFNDDMRAAPTRQTAADSFRSLLFLEERVRRTAEAPPAEGARRPRRRVELFDPPLAPAIAGVRFIEIAVDERSEAALVTRLTQLGFRLVGRHRSKEVTLYGQGDIRIVLNREPDSFAASFFLVHGPSVCAIALDTDDALAALGRAEAYGATRFSGRIGPDENAMPAVRAPDGSLIILTDPETGRDLDRDFVLTGDAPAGHLSRIDHIAQALPDGQLDSWVLFYRAVLGLEPEDSVVLPDPYGLVRSKAVSNAERTFRLPLNISESRNTATARLVTSFAGAGVHHIALETDDIFAAAEALKASGAALLPIPANYYDDVVARFGLDAALVARMQSLGILYDRVGEGEFLHLYTTPFEERFYFELVQRRNGYDLYGAPNAPVRMAALAALRGPNLSQVLR